MVVVVFSYLLTFFLLFSFRAISSYLSLGYWVPRGSLGSCQDGSKTKSCLIRGRVRLYNTMLLLDVANQRTQLSGS